MDSWVIVVIVMAISTLVLIIHEGVKIPKKKKAMEIHLSRVDNFNTTQKIMGADGNTGMAIDEQSKKVCLISSRQKSVSLRVVSYKDLLSSELFEDGATVTKTVRSSQIGGALIGGLALGGVGAIIGGLSGKTQTSGKVKKIDLRLTINDTKSPLHDVCFLNLETKKDSSLYRQVIQQARHWHGLVEVLIKRADIEDKGNITSGITQIHPRSIADEIKKLADLRDSGVLSIDEFQQQKVKLLGS